MAPERAVVIMLTSWKRGGVSEVKKLAAGMPTPEAAPTHFTIVFSDSFLNFIGALLTPDSLFFGRSGIDYPCLK